MTLGVCDKVGVAADSWLAAQTEIIRIFYDAGVDVTWIDLLCNLTGAFVPASPDAQSLRSKNGYFMIVIQPDRPRNWSSPDALGFAPVQTGPYPRAYIFYKLVLAFTERHVALQSRNSTIGIVLGHVIAHELGHLLIPGKAHGYGIMRGSWGNSEWDQAFSGTLKFHPDHIRLIQDHLRSK